MYVTFIYLWMYVSRFVYLTLTIIYTHMYSMYVCILDRDIRLCMYVCRYVLLYLRMYIYIYPYLCMYVGLCALLFPTLLTTFWSLNRISTCNFISGTRTGCCHPSCIYVQRWHICVLTHTHRRIVTRTHMGGRSGGDGAHKEIMHDSLI